MESYFIVRDVHSGEFEYIRGFACARCMLPEQILGDDYLREVLMRQKYSDYDQASKLYERRYNTGEISSEMLNFTREAITGTHGIKVHSANELNGGIIIRMRSTGLV